ncbi:MAG: hypothetical protein KDA28_05720, partial [Phycisphaerales bacterium]|nr:hypothetical protein [Phycisphaerales bacterium]
MNCSRDAFIACVEAARGDDVLMIPVSLRLLSDQLTPVLAYRRLVAPDERTAPSFLLESVEGGDRQGRHSILGAHPVLQVVARGHEVVVREHGAERTERVDNPMEVARSITSSMRLVHPETTLRDRLPDCFLGGWVGYASYDTVRYVEPTKLDAPPLDDRHLPDLHFGLYDETIIFDHVDRVVHVVHLARVGPGGDAGRAYDEARAAVLTRA